MAYKVLVVDDQAMPRQLFENIIKSAVQKICPAGFSSNLKIMARIFCINTFFGHFMLYLIACAVLHEILHTAVKKEENCIP